MKKTIIAICMICLCVLLTGCGNNLSLESGTLNCSKTETDEDGYTTTYDLIATYKNNKITKIEETSVMETDPELIDFTFNILNAYGETLDKIDGINAKYTKVENNKIKLILTADYSKINKDSIKEALGDSYDENDAIFSNFDITVDDFKQSQTSDSYICD